MEIHKNKGPIRGCWCDSCEELRVMGEKDLDPKPGDMLVRPVPGKPCEDEMVGDSVSHIRVGHGFASIGFAGFEHSNCTPYPVPDYGRIMDGAEDPRTDPRFGDLIGFIPFAYHLLPQDGIAKVAAIMRKGEISGRPSDGWREVPVEEQINHAISHLIAYLAGRGSDHLAHAGCRVLMALDLEQDPVMGRDERDKLYKKAVERILNGSDGKDWAERAGGPMIKVSTE